MTITAETRFLGKKFGNETPLKKKQQIILEEYRPNDPNLPGFVRYVEVQDELTIHILKWVDHELGPEMESIHQGESINLQHLTERQNWAGFSRYLRFRE